MEATSVFYLRHNACIFNAIYVQINTVKEKIKAPQSNPGRNLYIGLLIEALCAPRQVGHVFRGGRRQVATTVGCLSLLCACPAGISAESSNPLYKSTPDSVNAMMTSIVEPEPEPQGAGTFSWSRSRNIEVSSPAPGSGSAKVIKKNQNSY
jgi:hypothetical protein